MAGPRNLPARSSQRRNAAPKEDESPMQTRRGAKSAAKPEQPEIVSPRSSRHSVPVPEAPLTRKATRTISSIPNYAKLDSAPDVYATYESPFFMVFGLTSEFFDGLNARKHKQKLKLTTRSEHDEEAALSADQEVDDSSTVEEEESDEPAPVRPATRGGRGGRGGGRGGRGGRGRGGRGRGSRGGRGGSRGASSRIISPLRTRPSRNAAPVFPLDDHDDPSNQSSPLPDANSSLQGDEHDENGDEDAQSDLHRNESDADGGDEGSIPDVKKKSFSPATPPGSPPPEVIQAYDDPSAKIPVSLSVPKISLPEKSSMNMSHDGTLTPAESVPKLLDPEDDLLTDSDLPDPWIENVPDPLEAECEDKADFYLRTRYKPMTDVQDIIASLQKHPFSARSTESLYALAENTQLILRAWQDQYLELDAKTAPHAHPPKKACNGGRIPMNHQQFEDRKEASLYGYTFDPKKPPGMQDPFLQRPGHEKTGRRELRQRRTRDMLDSAAPSEEEEEDEENRPAKRQRRATRPFEISEQGNGTGTGTSTPKKKNNGWGGARKKGVSKYAQPTTSATATPEPESRGKRGKALAAALHHRIQAMREESAVASSSDEGGSSNVASVEVEETPPPVQKRGRPAGSKNVARRSDYGQKKGPRKKVHEEEISMTTQSPNHAQPQMLQSLSEGQSQFTIDASVAAHVAPTPMAPHSTETVFQATPQPLGIADSSSVQPLVKAQTPDAYMNTTPLSQYNTAYMDDSGTNSGSNSKRKPRVKSEKRSQSMTIWWAERKARQKEMEEKSGATTPIKVSPVAPAPPLPTSHSRSNSASGRRGGRPPKDSTSSRPPSSHNHHPHHHHHHSHPHNPHQQQDMSYPHSAHPELYAIPAPEYPLIARGPFHSPTEYTFSTYALNPSIPAPSATSTSTPGGGTGTGTGTATAASSTQVSPSQGRALAPAPPPSSSASAAAAAVGTVGGGPSYPNPFGPRRNSAKERGSVGARGGEVALAPAPAPAPASSQQQQHVSPYPPLSSGEHR
ncbi:hypothetical protein DM02DRAFT_729844 [Periconia macrospinosa]|uniref:Uncharacterized protein n=1 Tax=Periconia macrospinosa TaxID=97972 RepID=A0A2V1DJZ3_9PLEO|nr:hypothetical protein DM02DRAFT_729844 [Periconia macrospinosa]